MDRYSGPIGVPSQRAANSACSLLTAITFLGRRADITGPCSGVLDAGPDDGTPMFQSPGERWTALVACNCARRGRARVIVRVRHRNDDATVAHSGVGVQTA
jgi:hypothetical protein